MPSETTYNSRDARKKWRDVLDHVQGGGSVTVTRSGKAVARITPILAPSRPRHGVEDCPVDVAVPPNVQVGTRWEDLTDGQRLDLPVGTTILLDTADYRETCIKQADGRWHGDKGTWTTGEIDDWNVITFLPDRE